MEILLNRYVVSIPLHRYDSDNFLRDEEETPSDGDVVLHTELRVNWTEHANNEEVLKKTRTKKTHVRKIRKIQFWGTL